MLILCMAAGCGPGSGSPADGGSGEVYTRDDPGEPVSAAELAEVTDLYLDLLQRRHYFEFVDRRAHGWPRSDPDGRYWYGTWWSGVSVIRQDGQVIFRHSQDGADNNGLRTAPLLEAACFARRLWQRPEDELLLRKLMRGFCSWAMAMERPGDPASRTTMARAHYPESAVDTVAGFAVTIDYSPDRPGLDNNSCQYVHIPDNPHWGDIWIKNKRSKDDVGHMMRALAILEADLGPAAGGELGADLQQLGDLYRAFSLRVEADGWAFATWDQDGQVWIPPDDLAHFTTLENGECVGILPLRLFGHGDPGEWDCGNGISSIDAIIGLKASNAQMLRSFHEAAVAQAFLAGQDALARRLLDGLVERIVPLLDELESADPPEHPGPEDMAELIVQAANVGLPLTWREVRYVHQRIRQAHAAYLDPSQDPTFSVFDPATADGTYPFTPAGAGLAFRNLGVVLGDCASPLRNPTSRPILDCERVRAARP